MIRAIIIDDEERARRILQSIVEEYCPNVEIVGAFSNVPEAVIGINQLNPDLVFLDVEMPEYSGFDLLNFFKTIDFDIVFVTAYNEFAIRAFEVSAVDYLLKPVEISLLQKAIEKVENKRKTDYFEKKLEILQSALSNETINKIALPMGEGLLFVEVANIILLEAEGAYTYVSLKDGSRLLVSKKLKFFEDLLDFRPQFFRPHRSHIINLNFVKKYLKGEGSILMDNNSLISVSRDKKGEFERILKELKYTA
jgi:two-component system LytT family response regulator